MSKRLRIHSRADQLRRMFWVRRICRPGECPVSDGDCDCSEPLVQVDVDELTPSETAWFRLRGTELQQAVIRGYLRSDECELLAGRPEPEKRIECSDCSGSLDCIRHSVLHHEGW